LRETIKIGLEYLVLATIPVAVILFLITFVQGQCNYDTKISDMEYQASAGVDAQGLEINCNFAK